jgi:exonuclease SbcC
MRLLKLKVRNIASLKGEHQVDFEAIMKESPLFAITGETGAGKSTLLNSIGLALYGKIYKPHVQQNDVVTIGEKEGHIELIFEAKGKTYLASWRARVLKANGEPYSTPQSPLRELYVLKGNDFQSEKMITTTKVDDILNLDYEQFCKCVILNQGEFARFLNSPFNERKDILEKLYPGEVLESLSRELKLEIDAVSHDKNQLEVEAHTLKADGEDEQELKTQGAGLKSRQELLENWSTLLEKTFYHFGSVKSYHRKFHEYEIRKAQTEKEFAAETTTYNALLKVLEDSTLSQKLAEAELGKREPELQELIKEEIELDHLRAQYKTDSQKAIELESKIKLARTNRDRAEEKNQGLIQKLSGLSQNFHYPLPLLEKLSEQLTDLFECWSKHLHLHVESKSKENSLEEIQQKGKELSEQFHSLKKEFETLPGNISETLTKLQLEKKELQVNQELRNKQDLALNESKEALERLSRTSLEVEGQITILTETLKKSRQELLPISTSLKLQKVLSAVKTCLEHEESRSKGECPVCHSEVKSAHWQELLTLSAQNDFCAMESKAQELEREIVQKETELIHAEKSKKEFLLLMNEARGNVSRLTELIKVPLPSLNTLEEQMALMQKQLWDQERLKKEIFRVDEELQRSRLNYKIIREEIQRLAQEKTLVSKRLLSYSDLLGELSDEVITKLKSDSRVLHQYRSFSAEKEKLEHELAFLITTLTTLDNELEGISKSKAALQVRTEELESRLKEKLGLGRASDLLEKLKRELKEATLKVQKSEAELKAQENKLKEFRSKIYACDEQLRENEILFGKSLKEVRETAAENLPEHTADLKQLFQKLTVLSLSLKDPEELFIPLHDVLSTHAESLKKELTANRESLAAVTARLEDWEKKHDKIRLLELKLKDLQGREQRLLRLSEVLGKDELRSFVLSLVEENLIRQTNQELLRLCQGRYEIIHQTKGMRLTPEFYILDKFREGGRRKVSTLSGGETFMVSLAMALGLAELTRGQAEIDSLFIDEGFGTLDQESLEDVLEMLNQIQTRGLMVGIISHIKTLTAAVPVNLVLHKKQDGTSTIGQKFN